MKFLFTLILISSFVFVCKSQTISPVQAKDNIGQKVTVCGQVYGCYHAVRVKGEPTFIDMGAAYPNSTFTVLIWGSDLNKFNFDLKTLQDKNICVSGIVKEYKGKPEIIVYNESQLKIE